MMSAVTRVLLVACAGFLVAQARMWLFCIEHVTGAQAPKSIYMDTVPMFPQEYAIVLTITSPCGPLEKRRGLRAVACDADAPMDVQFLNATHVRALRSGSLKSPAFIFLSGVCEN